MSRPRFGVIVFAGTNCDHDTVHVLENVCGFEARLVWHEERDLSGLDAVIVPGGFAHGDYLRAGAIARFDPVMEAVGEFAGRGGLVLGICNGFQVLLEAHLLPGAMRCNRDTHFLSRPVYLRVETTASPFTSLYERGEVLKMPAAHGEGNYYVEPETLAAMETRGQVLFRYCDARGEVSEATNPNGSVGNVAGIMNERGNVAALMPHPERASEPLLGSDDGRRLFASMAEALLTAGSR